MNQQLNIAYLFYARPHLGGSGIMSMDIAKEMAKRGHNVDIVSYPGTYLTTEERTLGIKLHPVEDIAYPCFKAEPYNSTLASMVANLGLEHGRAPDIIHANYAITHGEAALTAKRILKRKMNHDARVIITSHGTDIHTNGHHRLLAPGLELSLSESDAITFVSDSLREEAKKLFNLDNYGDVIYNFVDEERFSPGTTQTRKEIRNIVEIPCGAFVVYHASNFRLIKNTPMLIEAAARLRDEGKEVYLLMVGSGPDKADARQTAEKYDLLERTKFVGMQQNVVPYIQASDVGVLCSQRESFGLATLEVMACGLPVIGTDVGGIPEVIRHEKNGYLVEANNSMELARRIGNLMGQDNADRRASMGNVSLQIVNSEFSRKRIVDQYEQLYLSLNPSNKHDTD